jgi:hypothetical protein
LVCIERLDFLRNDAGSVDERCNIPRHQTPPNGSVEGVSKYHARVPAAWHCDRLPLEFREPALHMLGRQLR